ncbi:hypothetical protein [Kitasatospora purpeofusca]|uniref:hypothetical protein n=1 Tax=Kitasatospora purpeofusca TaxID=67352 RepID=UPI0036A369A1
MSSAILDPEATALALTVGTIAAAAAQAAAPKLNLSVEFLLARFTTDRALDAVTATYLRGIQRGLPPADAAAEAGRPLLAAAIEAAKHANAAR